MEFDGIYTAYLTGKAGQGMAMFVFKDGKIAGADMSGLTFSGSFSIEDGRASGTIAYQMPQGSVSITGVEFGKPSDKINVPFHLPIEIDKKETYRINTPIGPLNARFIKNTDFL